MASQVEPKSDFMNANDLRIHYLDWPSLYGKAPVLVALHGSGGEAHRWDFLARHLQPDYRLVALDLRGHGESDKPATGYAPADFAADVAAFVKALGIGRFTLIGHSLGSRIGVAFAALYPQGLERLILVDPTFDTPPEVFANQIKSWEATPYTFDNWDAAFRFFRTNPLSHRYSDESIVHAMDHGMVQLPDGRWQFRYSKQAVLEGLRHIPDDLWPYGEKVACPTLIIKGAESDRITPEGAKRMLSTIKQSEMVAIPAAGHSIPLDNPAGFNKAVGDWLDRG